MRCYEFSDAISLESLRLVERPDPTPGPHDIVIRMRAAAFNFRDVAMLRGSYHIGVSPPLIPLSDGAGDVIRSSFRAPAGSRPPPFSSQGSAARAASRCCVTIVMRAR